MAALNVVNHVIIRGNKNKRKSLASHLQNTKVAPRTDTRNTRNVQTDTHYSLALLQL